MARVVRRPQKPKPRNFVAKHSRQFAGRAGPHKDEKHDYERRPRGRPGKGTMFNPHTGEEIDMPMVEVNWVVGNAVNNGEFTSIPEVPDGQEIKRVWTILDEDELYDQGLVHNVTAFLEDEGHDYKIVDGKLKYFSRLSDKDEIVRVAFEYELPELAHTNVPRRRKMA